MGFFLRSFPPWEQFFEKRSNFLCSLTHNIIMGVSGPCSAAFGTKSSSFYGLRHHFPPQEIVATVGIFFTRSANFSCWRTHDTNRGTYWTFYRCKKGGILWASRPGPRTKPSEIHTRIMPLGFVLYMKPLRRSFFCKGRLHLERMHYLITNNFV